MKKLFLPLLILFLIGCATKKPIVSQSATILLKTPTMKFYDKGFITKYNDYTQLQIYAAGQKVLDLSLYEDQVCQSTFECMDNHTFNTTYLHPSYAPTFLKTLLEKEEAHMTFKDRANGIMIKIKKD